MPGPAVRILVVAALSILALVGLVVRESIERRDGAEVILRMEAVDPRALLTGHYVSVSLREALSPGVACPPGTDVSDTTGHSAEERTAWIALARRGDHASVAGQTETRAEALRLAPLAVRGGALCQAATAPSGDEPGRPGFVTLDVGVDRFHVSQSEAERIDTLLAGRRTGEEGPVSAIVSIGRDGRARLKGLVVEGRRLELSLL